jgi:hypothetical protein
MRDDLVLSYGHLHGGTGVFGSVIVVAGGLGLGFGCFLELRMLCAQAFDASVGRIGEELFVRGFVGVFQHSQFAQGVGREDLGYVGLKISPEGISQILWVDGGPKGFACAADAPSRVDVFGAGHGFHDGVAEIFDPVPFFAT